MLELRNAKVHALFFEKFSNIFTKNLLFLFVIQEGFMMLHLHYVSVV